MKQTLLFAACAALFFACTPDKKTCVDTGCSAGTTCNAASGLCELPPLTGGGSPTGGGTAQGGGSATGGGTTGGGAATGGGDPQGGGTSTTGGGSGLGGGTGTGGGSEMPDAGPVVDPYDDGGVFVEGDICNRAIPVDFDGGAVVSLSVDLSVAQDQYHSSCSASSSSGNDLIFAVTLAQEGGLRVLATDTSGEEQDSVVSVLRSPCAAEVSLACVDAESEDPETLIMERLPAGTYYVLLDNYTTSDTPGTYQVEFELLPPEMQPANDLCSAATPLNFTNNVATVMGTTLGAFKENALSCVPTTAVVRDVFYSFTLAQPQDVLMEVSSTVIAPTVGLVTDCTGTTELACIGGSTTTPARSRVTNLPAGTYTVVVDSRTLAAGDFTLTVTTSTATPPPANDLCTGAVMLAPNASQMVNLNDARADYGVTCGSSTTTGGDAVYTFTTTTDQRIKITADQTTTNVVLSLRRGVCEDPQSEARCSNSTSSTPEVLDLLFAPAGTYYVIASALSNTVIPGTTGISLELLPAIPPPANDSCAMPATLTPNATVMLDAYPANADFSFDDGNCFTGTVTHDVVYTFTLTQTQRVVIDATAGLDTNVFIDLRGDGTDCLTSGSLNCAEDNYDGEPERIAENVLPAGTYYVFVGVDTDEAEVGLSLTIEAPPSVPANDTCAGAATLVPNMSVSVNAVLAAADLTPPDSDCTYYTPIHDVVYTFTTTMAQRVVLTATSGPTTNAILELRSGACEPGTVVACQDYYFGEYGADDVIAVNNLPAGTYWVVVSADTDDADIGLTLDVQPVPPAPTNDTCTSAEVVTFTAGAATRTVDLSQATAADFLLTACASGADGLDVVYEVTIPAGETLTVGSTAASGDVVLAARSPVCAMNGEVECADDGAGGDDEELVVENTTAASMTVFVIVKEYSSGAEDVVSLTFTLQ